MPKKKNETLNNMKIIRMILTVLFIALFAVSIYFFIENRKINKQLTDPSNSQPQQEIDDLISKVGALIILPEGQEPIIATVKDVDALAAQQPFFRDAENGDMILIYKEKAIIYSTKKNKLVNVGPVFANNTKKDNTEPTIED